MTWNITLVLVFGLTKELIELHTAPKSSLKSSKQSLLSPGTIFTLLHHVDTNNAQSEQLPCMYLCYTQTWPWQSHIRPPARLAARQEHRLCLSPSILSNYCVSEDRTLKEQTTSLPAPCRDTAVSMGFSPRRRCTQSPEGCPPPTPNKWLFPSHSWHTQSSPKPGEGTWSTGHNHTPKEMPAVPGSAAWHRRSVQKQLSKTPTPQQV